jgi:hypothetical protein
MKKILLIVFLLLPSMCIGDECEKFFSTIPGEYTCIVSKNTTLTYAVKGGNGGTWGYDKKTKECADQGLAKGLGASIKGKLDVKKNEVLYITVGSSGENGCETGGGGGGGGYSSISMNNFNQNPIVVAGGGGGNSFGSRGVGGNGGVVSNVPFAGSGGDYPDGNGESGGFTMCVTGQNDKILHSGGREGAGLTNVYSGGAGGNTNSIGQYPQQMNDTGAAGGGSGFGGYGGEGGYFVYQEGGGMESIMGPGGPKEFTTDKNFGAGGQGGVGAGGGGGGYAGGGGGGSNLTDSRNQRSGLDGAGGGGGGSSLMPLGAVVLNSSSEPAVTFLAPPVVQSVNPNSGSASGGTTIEVVGSGFMPNAKVSIGGAPCVSLSFISPNKFTCITGKNSATKDVIVINEDTQIALGVGLWQALKILETE